MKRPEYIAAKLFTQRHGRKPFEPLLRRDGVDSDFAYTAQECLVDKLALAGAGHVFGWKVGLTTPRMQKMCGVQQPIAGAVLSQTVRSSGATIRSADYNRLGIECELAVRIGSLPTNDAKPENIVDYLDKVCAAFEIIDDRNADYNLLDAQSIIADNAWNAGAVLGDIVSMKDIDQISGLQGCLCINGSPVDCGTTDDVVGGPLNIVGWLAANLAKRNKPLMQGQWVLTGSIVTTKFPAIGDQYKFRLGQLSCVELSIG